MARVIVFAGGGTGGHVFPALALAGVIRGHEPDADVRFLGTERGIGARSIREAGYPLDAVDSAPVVGRGAADKLRALAAVARGVWKARGLLRRHRAQLVVGMGGYASVPAVAGAISLGVPTVLLEADSTPGRANRLMGRFARVVFVQFEAAIAHFPAGKAERVGFPVRPLPAHRERAAGDGLRILVTGGSQGAHSLNEAICAALPEIAKLGLRVTHQTGEADVERVRSAYTAAALEARVEPFFDDMPECLASSDLVLARSGSSVAEFCAVGLPQILVPYPHAAGDHQRQNARELERAGAAVLIDDAELGARLVPELQGLVSDDARRERMGRAARAWATPDAAERIWQRCRRLLEGGAS
jgi:UDP-N-acetylglucosamine--N-acetylmuramyl-(pentapeptide) pyrophosphoryl-undecaprenol N-acetylglucosamine transferase